MSNGINMIKFIKADLDTVAAAALILNELPENIYVLLYSATSAIKKTGSVLYLSGLSPFYEL